LGLAELALADRAGIRIGERDQAVGDLLAANALDDLLGDLFAAIGELVEPGGCPQLGLRAAPARFAPGGRCEPPRLLDGACQKLPGLAGQAEHLGLGLPAAPTNRPGDRA